MRAGLHGATDALSSDAFLSFVPLTALAQGAAPVKPEMAESCPGLVAQQRPPFMPAALRLAALKEGEVRISYAGHSTFLIESPKLVRIATDYNDYVKPSGAARHRDHEPGAFDALHRPAGARHQVRAARLEGRRHGRPTTISSSRTCACARSRPTSATMAAAARSATATRSSSSRSRTCASRISATCITRSPSSSSTRSAASMSCWCRSTAAYTLDLEGMIEVLTALKAPLMIPMHFFSTYTLNRFMERISKDWDVETRRRSLRRACRNTHCRQSRSFWCCPDARSRWRARPNGRRTSAHRRDPAQRDRDACRRMRRRVRWC